MPRRGNFLKRCQAKRSFDRLWQETMAPLFSPDQETPELRLLVQQQIHDPEIQQQIQDSYGRPSDSEDDPVRETSPDGTIQLRYPELTQTWHKGAKSKSKSKKNDTQHQGRKLGTRAQSQSQSQSQSPIWETEPLWAASYRRQHNIMMPILDNKTKPLTSVGDVSATEPPPLQTEKKLEAFLAKAGVTRSDFDEAFRGDPDEDTSMPTYTSCIKT